MDLDLELKIKSVNHDPIVHKLKSLIDDVKDDDVKKRLCEILDLRNRRDSYAVNFNTPVSPALQNILKSTEEHDWPSVKTNYHYPLHPRMMSGLWAGQVLKMLMSIQNAKTALEIGMFTGYGTLAMAEALPPDGEIITCDIEPYLGELARSYFDKSPHGKKITIKIGPALETIKALAKEGKKVDFVFIDANKDGYVEYYKTILDTDLLAPRGTIAFDNIYWGGRPYMEEEYETDVMRTVNKAIMDDPRIYQVLLPVRDGIALARRKEDIEHDS